MNEDEDFVTKINSSLRRYEKKVAKQVGQSLHDNRVIAIRVTDALDLPWNSWRQFVEALCAAPFMIADVTDFEPGVMLALGVRGAVRRGVTIASTAKRLDEAGQLSSLPFNIQETKLISRNNTDIGKFVSATFFEHDRHNIA